ncbi:hypothetical protein M404DRAFT_35912 [Pisolithus tinctorius Marx 270]|uniref:Uncharacterized protein n=1 Tax=Pisolithus tinctorius Marx 270 TaxID=870435 RepID=A0A0C3NCQ6_PISTI|nr:hypothetical protein M404DRAFT_35912 [Pisolithus tinctorius Marx 270]
MSSPFNPKAINEEIRRRFWAIEPERVGSIQFGGVTRGVDYDYQTTPDETTSPLAHRSAEPVRTLGSAQGRIDDASDVPSKAVAQPVHELGSTPQGCAPDPPAATGVDSIAHAGSDEFVKPRSPARSNVSLVPTSVLLDQNRWPAWMRDEPEVNTKNEDKLSPKIIWSELVENDEDLRKTVPQCMKHGQSTSDASVPRLTAEVKGKWKALARSETSEERPVNVNAQRPISEREEQDKNTKYLILKLKEAGLIKQLDSAEALICEQQAIIKSFKRRTKCESTNLGPSGLSVEQKEHVPQTTKNIGLDKPDNADATKYYFTDSTKPAKRSESPEITIDRKAHRKDKTSATKVTSNIRASSVFPRESTVLRAVGNANLFPTRSRTSVGSKGRFEGEGCKRESRRIWA